MHALAPDRELQVVIADDHAVVRDGLRLLLDAEPGVTVVAEAETADDAVRKVLGYKPDVLVLDLNMPGGSSLERVADIHAASATTRIVMLTMQAEPEYARHALRAGVHGYVLKEAAGAELLHAIETALAGGTYLSPSLGARLAAAPDADEALPDGLTPREAEVLNLLSLGHTNAEIAEQLHLSRRTVESHRSSLQTKTVTTTRAELVRYAIAHGLVHLEAGVTDA